MSVLTLVRYWGVVYALILIGGGIVGYTKKKSMASLIAGSFSGSLILVAVNFCSQDNFLPSLFSLSVMSLGLLAFFWERYVKADRKFMPSGLMALISGFSLLLFYGSLVMSYLVLRSCDIDVVRVSVCGDSEGLFDR